MDHFNINGFGDMGVIRHKGSKFALRIPLGGCEGVKEGLLWVYFNLDLLKLTAAFISLKLCGIICGEIKTGWVKCGNSLGT